MTKITVINTIKTEEKKIEFRLFIDESIGAVQKPIYYPEDFDNISVIKTTGTNYDIFICERNNNPGVLAYYLGHFNDGII
jgi:hypothetical protein